VFTHHCLTTPPYRHPVPGCTPDHRSYSFRLNQRNFQLNLEIATDQNPPVSSAAFHIRPNSLRLILVVADAPADERQRPNPRTNLWRGLLRVTKGLHSCVDGSTQILGLVSNCFYASGNSVRDGGCEIAGAVLYEPGSLIRLPADVPGGFAARL